VILAERDSFPTDLYIAEGVAASRAGAELRLAGDNADLADMIDERTAVMLINHVDYRTGALHDMAHLTRCAHQAGALVVWDLCHSAGVVPIELDALAVDFAIGCTYKYLNGGPGAPAFLYIAEHLQERLVSPLRGWMGHARPFAFVDEYAPAGGIDRFLAGTPAILNMIALESGIEAFEGVTMERLWTKSRAMFDVFHALMEQRCPDLVCITPRGEDSRGSHISFSHPHAFEICQALIAEEVIGDFRAPDVIRFGLTPLYLGFEDIWIGIDRLARIMENESWREPRFAVRGKVT